MNAMRYCGPSEHAHLEKVPTPEDAKCIWCDEELTPEEHGFVMDHISEHSVTDAFYHQECMIRSTVGSVAHQMKTCSCYGGTETDEDDPAMTKRESAKAAAKLALVKMGD
jgi:hypothetical protein